MLLADPIDAAIRRRIICIFGTPSFEMRSHLYVSVSAGEYILELTFAPVGH